MNKRITIMAFDKDSGASYTNTFPLDKNLKVNVKEQFNPSFSRYYTEAEVTGGARKLTKAEVAFIVAADVVELSDIHY